MSYFVRILYIFIGWLILFPVCYYSIGRSNLPKYWFYYDNTEDGFTGNKRKIFGSKFDTGWYDNYIGIKSSELNRFKQAWYAYRWSAWRNPAWNLRFHPKVSINIDEQTIMRIKGNTVSHDWKSGKQWYDVVTDGKYKSYFRLIPITKNKSLYLRWGWKIYPEYYGGKIPEHKRRSIQAISIRIRGAE
jgi:hypothetical protein